MGTGKSVITTLGSMNKAAYIELFYDLVFIVCLRCIIPVIAENGAVVGWYEYYCFAFTFFLMMQVWFSSTVLVNRCGDGGPRDARCLVISMFLLFIMTRSISTGWEHYIAFNVSWILMNVNLLVNWQMRYRDLKDVVDKPTKRFIVRIFTVHAAQIVLVLISFLFPSMPAQICCLAALLVGFASWPCSVPLTSAGQEHLAERCSLFLILAFGENLMGVNSLMQTEGEYATLLAVFNGIVYFFIIVGMFLVFLVEMEKKLDPSKLGGGSRFMALTGLVAFLITNVSAALEMMAEDHSFALFDAGYFLVITATLFLLSTFLYHPFDRPPIRRSKWFTGRRVLACLLPVLVTLAIQVVMGWIEGNMDNAELPALIVMFIISIASLVFFVISTYAVFVMDYHAYTLPRNPKKRGERGLSEVHERPDAESESA